MKMVKIKTRHARVHARYYLQCASHYRVITSWRRIASRNSASRFIRPKRKESVLFTASVFAYFDLTLMRDSVINFCRSDEQREGREKGNNATLYALYALYAV
jgi:hypothetical protein